MNPKELRDELDIVIATVKAAPPWKQIAGAIILLTIIMYLGWVIWDLKHPTGVPGSVITNATLPEPLQEFETETLVTKTTYYPNKNEIETKLGLPTTNVKQELLVTGGEIAPNKYGATTIVYHNTSTAGYRTTIKYKEAPWFAFRRDLAIGAGAGVGTQGTSYAGRVRLDVLQIKEIIVSPEVEINYSENRTTPVESKAMVWFEWRP